MSGLESCPRGRGSAWKLRRAFAALGLAARGVLWPDGGWEFDAIPNQIITSYIERPPEPADPIWVVHRDLSLHMANSYVVNERRLRTLRIAYRVAV